MQGGPPSGGAQAASTSLTPVPVPVPVPASLAIPLPVPIDGAQQVEFSALQTSVTNAEYPNGHGNPPGLSFKRTQIAPGAVHVLKEPEPVPPIPAPVPVPELTQPP
jgi:hypothetical protein